MRENTCNTRLSVRTVLTHIGDQSKLILVSPIKERESLAALLTPKRFRCRLKFDSYQTKIQSYHSCDRILFAFQHIAISSIYRCIVISPFLYCFFFLSLVLFSFILVKFMNVSTEYLAFQFTISNDCITAILGFLLPFNEETGYHVPGIL